MIPLKTLSGKPPKYDRIRTFAVGGLALAAGLVNGFLGTGGGILLMTAMSLLPPADEAAQRDRFAAVIAVILPLSLISVVTYGGAVDMRAAVPYLFPGILGGVTGALLLDVMQPRIVKRLFAVMVIWAGVQFLR